MWLFCQYHTCWNGIISKLRISYSRHNNSFFSWRKRWFNRYSCFDILDIWIYTCKLDERKDERFCNIVYLQANSNPPPCDLLLVLTSVGFLEVRNLHTGSLLKTLDLRVRNDHLDGLVAVSWLRLKVNLHNIVTCNNVIISNHIYESYFESNIELSKCSEGRRFKRKTKKIFQFNYDSIEHDQNNDQVVVTSSRGCGKSNVIFHIVILEICPDVNIVSNVRFIGSYSHYQKRKIKLTFFIQVRYLQWIKTWRL